MTSVTERAAGGVTRPVIVAAVSGTFALAFAAFLLSYVALRDLAALAGVPAGQAWLWPLIVDGVILEATISVVALREGAATARRYAWFLLVAGAAVSVGANITHAVVSADARVPGLVAALVASVPPLVLVAMTHLTVELIRNAAPRSGPRAGYDPARRAAPEVVQALVSTVPPAITRGTDKVQAADQQPRADTKASTREQRERRRREAAQMAAEDIPVREIAHRLAVHPTTVSRWLAASDSEADAPDRPSSIPDPQASASDASAKEEDDEHDT